MKDGNHSLFSYYIIFIVWVFLGKLDRKRLQEIVSCLDNAVSWEKLFHNNVHMLETFQNIFLKNSKL